MAVKTKAPVAQPMPTTEEEKKKRCKRHWSRLKRSSAKAPL